MIATGFRPQTGETRVGRKEIEKVCFAPPAAGTEGVAHDLIFPGFPGPDLAPASGRVGCPDRLLWLLRAVPSATLDKILHHPPHRVSDGWLREMIEVRQPVGNAGLRFFSCGRRRRFGKCGRGSSKTAISEPGARGTEVGESQHTAAIRCNCFGGIIPAPRRRREPNTRAHASLSRGSDQALVSRCSQRS